MYDTLDRLLRFAGQRKNDVTNPQFTKQECIDIANALAFAVLRQYITTHGSHGEFPYLRTNELVVGARYLCSARNFLVGTWNGSSFDYMRTKFGTVFQDQEKHYDTDPIFGTVRPIMPASQMFQSAMRSDNAVPISTKEAEMGLLALSCVESELPEYHSLYTKLAGVYSNETVHDNSH